jgi:hypothetical protein
MSLTIMEIASIVTAISVTVAAFQIYILHKQLCASHERSRRVAALDLMKL